ncbi:MAG: hypothetical protein ACK5M4_05260 [Pseudorhodobacter sp.]
MTRHLADQNRKHEGGRVKNYLKIDREGGQEVWDRLRKKPKHHGEMDRRTVEFLRIDRGRSV